MMALPVSLAAVTLPFLGEIVALFVASIFIAYVCIRLKLVPIVGFLLAGVAIGPHALGLVQDDVLIESAAEIGVILLLFTIGVEFSLEKLAKVRRFVMVGGGLQVALALGSVVLVGLAFGVDWRAGVFTGCLIALSSTTIVLSLLSERAETDSPVGRLALAILIFQDLAIVAMVLLMPLLGGEGGDVSGLLIALGQALLVIGAVLLLARKIIPWLLERIAHTRRVELFLMTVVAICFGTAWIVSLVGVSLALGAFLAGLVVSESPYSEHALSEVLPLRTLFNAIFFVSVGLLLDVGFLIENAPVVLAVAVGVLLLKMLTTTASVLALGYPVRMAVAVGIILAQIGEFSFVLASAGQVIGLTPAALGEAGAQTFIAVTVVLMLVTPFMVRVAEPLGRALERRIPDRLRGSEPEAPSDGHTKLEDHVIVVGYGPAGRRLTRVLRETGVPFVVIELNPESVHQAEADGYEAIYGDATRPLILEHAAADRAKVCLIAVNDQAATRRIVRVVHHLNPTLQIIVRARFLAEVEPLRQAGADIVVPEELETAVRLFTHVLEAYMIAPEEIQRQAQAVRADDYGVFRGSIQEAHLMVLQGLDEDGLHTRAVAVREGAPVAGKTLAEIALRNRYGLTVLAVRRDRRTQGNPAGDFEIQPGDRLIMVGSAQQFVAAADLFREPQPTPV